MNILRDFISTEEPELEENASMLERVGVTVEIPNDFAQVLDKRFFIYCSVIGVGLILNLVVIIVYARRLQKSTYIFSFCLAICDFLNCLNLILDILKTTDVLPALSARAVCIAHPYLVDTGCLISGTLVLCLVIDRYLRSKYLKNSLSRTHCFALISAVVISSIIVTSPFLVARIAKLMKLNQSERDLMCREYHRHHTHYSDTNGTRVSNPRLFMLVFNGVILTLLIGALLAMAVLYVKMTLQIRKKSFSRPSKISPYSPSSGPLKNNEREIRGIRFDETSAEDSEMSSTEMEELADNVSTGSTEQSVNQSENKRKIQDKNFVKSSVTLRRKSSVFSMGKRFPSKILTPRYYCLIFLSLILFTFYFIHFLLHIINICRVDNLLQSSIQYGLLEFLRHSYVLCFILNPVIYSYLSRGFFRNFKRTFFCDKTQLYNRSRSSVDSSFL